MKSRSKFAFAVVLVGALAGYACGGESSGGPNGANSAHGSTSAHGASNQGAKPVTSAVASGAAHAASAAASGSSAVSSNEIKFTKADPKVNQTWDVETNEELDMDIAKPKPEKHHALHKSSRKMTVLAAEGKNVTKMKIVYGEITEAEKESGKEKKVEKSPISGKTYIAEFKDKKLNILDEKEKPAAAKEAELVKVHVERYMGKPDSFAAALPDVPVKKGDRVDSLADGLKELLKAEMKDPSLKMSGQSVILKDIKDGVGSFEVKYKLETKEFTLDMTGSVDVSAADGRLRRITMNGPMTVKAPSDGKGTYKVDETHKY